MLFHNCSKFLSKASSVEGAFRFEHLFMTILTILCYNEITTNKEVSIMSKGKGVSGNTHSRSQINNYANQNNPNNSANRANNNNRSNQMNPNNNAYHQSRNGNGKNGK